MCALTRKWLANLLYNIENKLTSLIYTFCDKAENLLNCSEVYCKKKNDLSGLTQIMPALEREHIYKETPIFFLMD